MNESRFRVRIDRRFCGPPQSGNGGYVTGVLAEHVAGDCQVRLLRPPPLERDLEIAVDGEGATLRDVDTVIARARPHRVSTEPPPAPTLEQARERSRGYPGFEDHAFGTCFVCGPDREPGEGLRIFPGPGPDGSVAATWRPDNALAGDDGHVRPGFVWAALDCPSGWAYLHPGGRVAVLGELAVHIDTPVTAGEQTIVVGWLLANDGRKHRCGSALYTARGQPLAWAESTWFDIDPQALSEGG